MTASCSRLAVHLQDDCGKYLISACIDMSCVLKIFYFRKKDSIAQLSQVESCVITVSMLICAVLLHLNAQFEPRC